ncbi:hypothetical protein AAHA92_15508 [Salvia divinorum]|uniref:Uncharacterized protein n=1 Tax=Salvia divinorum TaxID=28513 RepID=A0ABD1HGE1_SALDI
MNLARPSLTDLSPRRLGKSGVVGQQGRESAVHEKKTQCHMETEHSTMEEKRQMVFITMRLTRKLEMLQTVSPP